MAKNMYQKRKERQETNKEIDNKTNINWYPGHMAKTKREIKEQINLIDIIYEVIDARIPISSKIKDIDELIGSKPHILIMTKYDLCDKNETNKIIKYYEDDGYKVIAYDLNKDNLNKIFDYSNFLLKDFFDKRKAKGLKPRNIRALVLGIPNVGKSTLINRLVSKNAVKVGNRPGVTTSLNWIRVGKNIELLDSPGILWPRLDDHKIAYNLASMTAIKEEILPKEKVVDYIFTTLDSLYPNILLEKYNIKKYSIDNLEEILINLGQKRGFVLKGGVVDTEKALESIINDIKDSSITGITFDRLEDFNVE